MMAQSPAPAPSAKSRRLRRLTERFRRAEGGTAAVEFALISIPFFALLFGILELGLIFVLSTSLDNAASTASRKIRTGQMQMAGTASAANFKTDICNNLGWLASECTSNLEVDVRTFATFSQVVPNNPVQNGQLGATQFSPGSAGSIVLVRAYYKWTLISPLLTKAVSQLDGGKALVTSTLAFKNEPYN